MLRSVGVLATEMEAAALFAVATVRGLQAAADLRHGHLGEDLLEEAEHHQPAGGAADLDITFTTEKAWEDPGQKPYSATNMKFFESLGGHMASGQLVSVKVADAMGAALMEKAGVPLDEHARARYEEAVDLLEEHQRPGIVLVVGVNGTGKTTTVGKLALALAEEGKQAVLVAADTFRAAAAEQLAIWGERVGAQVVRHQQGADPAAVAFDGLASARARGGDVLLVDTAGRLHTKTNLMEELRKLDKVAYIRFASVYKSFSDVEDFRDAIREVRDK